MYSNLIKAFSNEGVERGVQAGQLWPSLLLHGFRAGILKHIFGKYYTGMVPGLKELARDSQTLSSGLFTIGTWANMPQYRTRDRNQWVAIDWEIVIRQGAHFVCDTVDMPSLAILAWELVREAAIRRSPPLAELLHRELIQACARVYNVEYDTLKYPMLTKHEEKLKDTILDTLFEDGYVVRSIRRNFRENFGEYTTEIGRLGATVREQLREVYSSDSKNLSLYLSVFSITRSSGIRRKKLPGMTHKGFDEDPFLNLPSKNNPHLYEIGHIYRLGAPSIDGVWRYKNTTHPLRPVNMLVVHMGRYAEYRTQGGCDIYTKQLKKKNIPRSAMIISGVHFADWFRERYPLFDINSKYEHLASLASDKEIYDLTKVTPDDLWIIPRNDVKVLLTRARDSSRGLERYRREPNKEQEKDTGHSCALKQRVFSVESPPITGMRNQTFYMKVLYWYGRLYFAPVTWEIPQEQTRYILRNGKYALHKGVYSHPDLDTQFYTLEFLSKVRLGGIADYSQVYEWLYTFQSMTDKQLRDLSIKSRLLEKRLYYQATESSYGNLPYSPEEAAFIIDSYRPDMTEKQIEKLKELLPGRNWASISRQALKLCKEMIDSGVLNYKKLPHRRKTDKMRIRIRRMKGQLSRAKAAKKKRGE